MGGVTYDTSALVAAERNNRRMWALHAGYLAEEVIPAVPARRWRRRGGEVPGRRAWSVSCACDIEPMSEDLARHVGYWPENRATMTSSMSLWWKAPSVAGTPS